MVDLQHVHLAAALRLGSHGAADAIDLVTLKEELTRAGEIEEVGGLAYLTSLVDGVPRSTNVEHYARIVKEKSALRALILASQRISARAYEAEDDPNIILNMSVWESIETLEQFVWQTIHKRFYGRKQEWFERSDSPHLVMWWIPVGHRPSVAEAIELLPLSAGTTDLSCLSTSSCCAVSRTGW